LPKTILFCPLKLLFKKKKRKRKILYKKKKLKKEGNRGWLQGWSGGVVAKGVVRPPPKGKKWGGSATPFWPRGWLELPPISSFFFFLNFFFKKKIYKYFPIKKN
jgi:hypothetical protein